TVERDHLFDAGVTQDVLPGLTVGIDSYYKKASDLIDEGQFGPALIFETFNYNKGRVWGTEFTSSYTHDNLYTYANFAYSVAQGTQVESGQFNFTPTELKYINSHYIFLDHDQTFTSSAGAAYRWKGYTLTFDGIYGSGLRSGFANTGNLPFYIQLNAAVIKRIELAEKARSNCASWWRIWLTILTWCATGPESESSPTNTARGAPFTAASNGSSRSANHRPRRVPDESLDR